MSLHFITITNLLLLVTFLTDFICKNRDRCFPLVLLRIGIALPLLAFHYFHYLQVPTMVDFRHIMHSELLVCFILIHGTIKLNQLTEDPVAPTMGSRSTKLFWLALTLAVLFALCLPSAHDILNDSLVFSAHTHFYWLSLFSLAAMLFVAVRLERFWNRLSLKQKWQFKFFIVGMLLACGTFIWIYSYRITYRIILAPHLLLACFLTALAWLLIITAIIRHSLPSQKITLSRKVVYTSIAPSIFIAYLLGLGLISLAMRQFGWSLPFILYWLLIAAGLVILTLLLLSGKVRHQVKYFISTHFYGHKYEYRDQWLALSEKLQDRTTPQKVVFALAEVLLQALYTTKIMVWVADDDGSLVLLFPHNKGKGQAVLPPLAHRYLQNNTYFYLFQPNKDDKWLETAQSCTQFFRHNRLSLLFPMTSANHFAGVIGLGEQFTGGHYGEDDFDLLRALGSQTASALRAAQTAELSARLREQSAWQTLSTFVLHDVKNAQTMLTLARQNAPEHIDKPEFQLDLLETVDDALKRMNKVQKRLGSLKGVISPDWRQIDVVDYCKKICAKLERKLSPLRLQFEKTEPIELHTDPDLLFVILENLLLNSLEAGADTCVISCKRAGDKGQAHVTISDNGPGISPELLPSRLFEPFVTAKAKGSGIGLWQVKQLMESIKADISVDNREEGGCSFVLHLPVKTTETTETTNEH